jgi:hypothetical protein
LTIQIEKLEKAGHIARKEENEFLVVKPKITETRGIKMW